MIVNKRGNGFVLLLLLVAASSTFSYHYCDGFIPCLRREGRWVPGAESSGGAAIATTLLHAFPSDKMEPTTTASKTALQNEHFASSQTTSSLSQDSRTTIAPPVLARPSTEAKGDDLKLARIEQKQQQQIEQEVQQHEEEQETQTTQVSVWDRFKPVDIQGGSQQTWSFAQHSNMVEVHIRSPYGNPINANVDLWQGPGNTPQKVLLYSEEGRARPFRCFFSTPPGGYSNSINIRNTATLEFPIQAVINGSSSSSDGGMDLATKEKMERIATAAAAASASRSRNQSGHYEKMVQGGATITERFEANVNSVQVYISSEGRPIHCRIELISGPNTMKQVMEVYCEEGNIRPFYTVIETPGVTQGVVRIINTSTMEFPFTSIVQPWDILSTREMNDQICQKTNHGLGGTSSPFFEVSGGYGGSGPVSTFGNVVSQFGGGGYTYDTSQQQYNTNTNNKNTNVRSVGSPAVGMGGLAVPRLKRAKMTPSKNTNTANNHKKKLLPPPPFVEKEQQQQQQQPVVDAEQIDIECLINDDEDDPIDMECAVGDIEAKIEAEVDRKIALHKKEEEERIVAKAWETTVEAAEKAAADAQITEEEKQQHTELQKLLEMTQKLEEQIEAEAEARFQERIQQQQKEEIENRKQEIERVTIEQQQQKEEAVRQEAAAVTAAEQQLQRELNEIEQQEDIERQKAAADAAEAEAVVQREEIATRKRKQQELKAAEAEAEQEAILQRKQQLELDVEIARHKEEERKRQIAEAEAAEAPRAVASNRRRVAAQAPPTTRSTTPPPPPRRVVLQIDDAFQ